MLLTFTSGFGDGHPGEEATAWVRSRTDARSEVCERNRHSVSTVITIVAFFITPDLLNTSSAGSCLRIRTVVTRLGTSSSH